MGNKEDKRANVDPMRIAWLLRADLRQGAPAGAPMSDWFKMWWLINGPREYPAWIDHEALRKSRLFKPLPAWPKYGGFGMTPALRFLLETRSDLADAFDVSTNEGLWDAISWLFVHGVREHQLVTAIDETILAALDTTPPFFVDENQADSGRPNITWLMFFVWKTSSDLKSRFDLRRTTDRTAYVTWFLFDGVPQLKLDQLLAPRWKEWLHELVLGNHIVPGVPRAAHLLWQRHIQLQQAFDLQTDRGVRALALWAKEVWSVRPEISWIDQAAAPQVARPHMVAERPFGLNLIGFAFGELGIGEDVRMAVAACEAAGIPFTVVNIHAGDTLRQADQALSTHVLSANQNDDQAPYAINVFCLTAFDTARVFLEKGASFFDGHYNIGWWPWELPVWPKDWLTVYDLVDEIWSATSFTHQMYIEAAALNSHNPTPVTLMPMAVSVDRVKRVTRSSLGLAEEKFLFLYVFDFNSYLARKNPLAAVEAFRGAFSEADQSVGLVLKTMNSKPESLEWQKFLEECDADSRITVIDRTMERGEVLGLIQQCNAYVSLHKAEGFGRTLAEAMLFGKPVIATNFSGNVDFLTESTGFPVAFSRATLGSNDYPYVTTEDNAWWGNPSISHASRQLRKSKEIWSAYRISALEQLSKKLFSPAGVGENMKARLQALDLH